MKKTRGKNNGTLTTLEPGDRLRGAGHPGGENFKTIANRYLNTVIKKVNPLTGIDEKLTAMELLFLSLFDKALKGDVPAAREILDRIEGKVTQPMDLHSDIMTEIKLIRADGEIFTDVSTSEQEIREREGL